MTQAVQDILLPGVVELYVKTTEPSDITELGSPSWFDAHERLQKLHQQAILEARELREESVKEMMISHNKIPILVHEAICISVWREKVLPLLLKITPEPNSVFIPYMVLFHEATAIEFMETLVYHSECCEALGENSLELLDYCSSAIIRLLAQSEREVPEPSQTLNASQDLGQKEMTLAFNIGIKCISIIGCIAQHLDSLPLSATSHMFVNHDIPLLLANIIEQKPWIKDGPSGKTLKFEDCKWQEIKGEDNMKVTRAEAQTWLALRQLLLDPRCPAHYDINEYHKNQLLKLQCFLHDTLLDQLSPLVELKYWLAKLASSHPPPITRRPLLLEVVPQIKQRLLEKNSKRWKKIAARQAEAMFCEKETHIKAIMKSLNETYDLDTLEALVLGPPVCVACGKPAPKKCSQCKAPYCGRECQVKDWSKHKTPCGLVSSHHKTGD
ncbi:Zinc finger MYND domain-containing protein 10 [Cryptotermes secundus]|uniref:Zinc finger MYND domain-containing protein 10 n=1 Tax=Cryptotermes secundus TaxID=105785 RepID=A0A2J7PTN8_9NEOP|nr:zinc finger MYND domain-containing protein 10 [Cryptotermes secundus]PNF19693.1 Zinc finger MYND domain-containing protein 10 [Cryptotermes secundus]